MSNSLFNLKDDSIDLSYSQSNITFNQEGEDNKNKAKDKITNYTKLDRIGLGGCSFVYKAHRKESNDLLSSKDYCAIKEIPQAKISSHLFKREVEIMSKLNHPHIVKYITHFQDEENYYIVMEYLPMSLINKKHKFNYRPAAKVAQIVCELISAVHYLHHMSPPILHRDIKLENIALDEKGNAKLFDFGISNYLNDSMDQGKRFERKTQMGTLLAPEVVNKQPQTEKVDIWNIGIVLYELLTGENLQYKLESYNGRERIKIEWPIEFNLFAKDTIMKILKVNPKERPLLEDIIKDSFFTKNVKDCYKYISLKDGNKDSITNTNTNTNSSASANPNVVYPNINANVNICCNSYNTQSRLNNNNNTISINTNTNSSSSNNNNNNSLSTLINPNNMILNQQIPKATLSIEQIQKQFEEVEYSKENFERLKKENSELEKKMKVINESKGKLEKDLTEANKKIKYKDQELMNSKYISGSGVDANDNDDDLDDKNMVNALANDSNNNNIFNQFRLNLPNASVSDLDYESRDVLTDPLRLNDISYITSSNNINQNNNMNTIIGNNNNYNYYYNNNTKTHANSGLCCNCKSEYEKYKTTKEAEVKDLVDKYNIEMSKTRDLEHKIALLESEINGNNLQLETNEKQLFEKDSKIFFLMNELEVMKKLRELNK